MNFSNLNRKEFSSQLAAQNFDLLVIGGGITGCGIALDAALRGMKTALVEKNDFASGTSSRSTKLIHGGLRYLKQFEIKLVHDVGRERAIVHRNARHIVIPEKMLLPIVHNGSLGAFSTAAGLWLYDFLAGVKSSEKRKMLNRHETLKTEPLLDFPQLLGGGLYYEYRTDDSRLVIEVAKSAFAQNACLLNYAEMKAFIYDNHGKITGARIYDKINHTELDIHARVVVNACGPWVDLLRKEDNSLQGKRLQLTKGVHLVFPYHRLPVKQAVYFDAGDGRMIFAIPRNHITYVGTTDTIYNRDLDKPHCEREDARYLLNAVNKMFPSVKLELDDIISSWAGLRPLIFEEGKSASELSRKDEIIVSPSGLISIAGGKLTGYRLMAEKIVDLVEKKLHAIVGDNTNNGRTFKPCETKNFRLSGGEFKDEEEFKNFLLELIELAASENIPGAKIYDWYYRYGKNTAQLIQKVKELKSLPEEKLHAFVGVITNKDEGGRPTVVGDNTNNSILEAAELLYTIENEMVYSLQDFMIRRTGKIFFDIENSARQIDYLSGVLATQFNTNGALAEEDANAVKKEFQSAVSFI